MIQLKRELHDVPFQNVRGVYVVLDSALGVETEATYVGASVYVRQYMIIITPANESSVLLMLLAKVVVLTIVFICLFHHLLLVQKIL